MGYLSKERNIIELMNAVKEFNKSRSEKLYLDIYGRGELENEIKEICSTEPYINFGGAYNNNQVDEILKSYMFGYVAYPNSEVNTILCSPNKLYDYVNNEVVIIGNDNYSLRKQIESKKIGFCSSDLLYCIEQVTQNYKWYYSNVKQLRGKKKSSDPYEVLINKLLEDDKN